MGLALSRIEAISCSKGLALQSLSPLARVRVPAETAWLGFNEVVAHFDRARPSSRDLGKKVKTEYKIESYNKLL